MLVDPDITTSTQIDNLFDDLNKDNVNIVFDASADEDYINSPWRCLDILQVKTDIMLIVQKQM